MLLLQAEAQGSISTARLIKKLHLAWLGARGLATEVEGKVSAVSFLAITITAQIRLHLCILFPKNCSMSAFSNAKKLLAGRGCGCAHVLSHAVLSTLNHML